MKFVCMKCESYMLFQRLDQPSEGTLGIQFTCPQCGTRFAMVTNPGETQLVHALGVKIGGRDTEPQPFELTRSTLKEATQPVEAAMGGTCPFPDMVKAFEQQKGGGGVLWSAEAKQRLERIPDFVRPMVQTGVEAYAGTHKIEMITPDVMDAANRTGQSELAWSPEAQRRLENIPSFVRPMAKKEIERIAKERKVSEVTEAMMDEAKDQFMKFSL